MKFETPIAEIKKFDLEDVLTTSSTTGSEEEPSTEESAPSSEEMVFVFPCA